MTSPGFTCSNTRSQLVSNSILTQKRTFLLSIGTILAGLLLIASGGETFRLVPPDEGSRHWGGTDDCDKYEEFQNSACTYSQANSCFSTDDPPPPHCVGPCDYACIAVPSWRYDATTPVKFVLKQGDACGTKSYYTCWLSSSFNKYTCYCDVPFLQGQCASNPLIVDYDCTPTGG